MGKAQLFTSSTAQPSLSCSHLSMAAALDLILSFSSPFTARRRPSRYAIACRASFSVVAGDVAPMTSAQVERSVVRLGLPSKGRMAEETLNLLKVLFNLRLCVS